MSTSIDLFEVIASVQRRRRWSAAEAARGISEAMMAYTGRAARFSIGRGDEVVSARTNLSWQQ